MKALLRNNTGTMVVSQLVRDRIKNFSVKAKDQSISKLKFLPHVMSIYSNIDTILFQLLSLVFRKTWLILQLLN